MLEAWFENRVVPWVGIVIGTLLLVFCGPSLPKSFKISGGGGVPGTYHVTGVLDCDGVTSFCIARDGTFSSDDGKVIRTGVQARLPKPVKHGDLRVVHDVGDEDEVFVRTNRSWQVGWPILGTTTALLLLGLAVQGLWMSRKRQGPGAT